MLTLTRGSADLFVRRPHRVAWPRLSRDLKGVYRRFDDVEFREKKHNMVNLGNRAGGSGKAASSSSSDMASKWLVIPLVSFFPWSATSACERYVISSPVGALFFSSAPASFSFNERNVFRTPKSVEPRGVAETRWWQRPNYTSQAICTEVAGWILGKSSDLSPRIPGQLCP